MASYVSGGVNELAKTTKQVELANNIVPESLQRNIFAVAERFGQNIVEAVADELRKSFNLIPRHYALLSVLMSRDAVNQQDLGDQVNVNRNMMVQLIDQLEKMQLAERTVNPSNRREHLIKITPNGKKIFQQAEKVVKAAEDRFTMGISASDRKTLIDIISRMAGMQKQAIPA